MAVPPEQIAAALAAIRPAHRPRTRVHVDVVPENNGGETAERDDAEFHIDMVFSSHALFDSLADFVMRGMRADGILRDLRQGRGEQPRVPPPPLNPNEVRFTLVAPGRLRCATCLETVDETAAPAHARQH